MLVIELSKQIKDVISERNRQIYEKGFSPNHDDTWKNGELILAAICYASFSDCGCENDECNSVPIIWPWENYWWKPSNKRRNLVKAAALIIAEIERLDREN